MVQKSLVLCFYDPNSSDYDYATLEQADVPTREALLAKAKELCPSGMVLNSIILNGGVPATTRIWHEARGWLQDAGQAFS